MSTVGKIIRELRLDEEITQEELGRVIGVSTSMIGMYETNARKPSYDVLLKMANYFKASTDYLLGRVSDCGACKSLISERAKIRERVEREIYYLANESEGDITGEIMSLRRALTLIDRDGDT